jgi:hypothetical protein
MDNESITMNSEIAKSVMKNIISQMNIYDLDVAKLMEHYKETVGPDYQKDWQTICIQALQFAIENLPD